MLRSQLPYVSYHNMFKTERVVAARIGFDTAFRVPLTANLWSHFIFHSLRFSRRLDAWRGFFLAVFCKLSMDVRYSTSCGNGSVGSRSYHKQLRRKKVFGDTTEKSEVLLCDRLGDPARPFVDVATAKSLTSCATILRAWDEPVTDSLLLRIELFHH